MHTRAVPSTVASGVLTFLLGLNAPSLAMGPRSTPPLPDPLQALEHRIVEQTLPNGLHVLILPRPISPTVSMNILFRVGAIDEYSGQTGTAHLLEHMMFKGTTTIGTKNYTQERPLLAEIDRHAQALTVERAKGAVADAKRIASLEQALQTAQQRHAQVSLDSELWELYTRHGADPLNAGTGLDLTAYVVRLPANKLELWTMLDADRLLHPVFRDFYKERDVVKEERRLRVESEPEGQLWESFLAAAFTASPYGRPTIGWMADLDRLTRQDAETFFQTHYFPGRATIAVVGNVDPHMALTLIRRYFGQIPPGPAQDLPDRITPDPPQHGERRLEVEWDAEPRLLIGYHKPTWPHPDDAVCEVLEQLLGRGRTSRFYKTLVEGRRVATMVSSENGTPGVRVDNLFVIEGVPRHPHSAHDLEIAVEAELQRLQRTPVSDQELLKVKQQLAADFIRALQSDGGMAWHLAQAQAVRGDWRSLLNRYRAIQAVTASDVQRVAQTYCVPRNRTIATLVRRHG